jgi:hypothetical protein
MKKTILKTMLAVVLISLCVIPFVYSAMATPPKPKIFFTWAPGGDAEFGAPPGKAVDGMMLWAAYMIGSTYGAFTIAVVDYYHQDKNTGVWHYEDHWYTTNLEAGKTYAALTVKVYSMFGGYVYDSYDVTQATIITNQPTNQADYLSVSVIAKGKSLFSVKYWADTKQPFTSELVGGACPIAQACGTRVLRPLANVVVTGIAVGSFQPDISSFRYLQTEVYDPSLLS